MPQDLTQQVREVALKSGAALVGFGPISRFDQAPRHCHPSTIFPQAKTAIAIAVPQARGALKAVEEGTYWQAYNCDSYAWLNEVFAPAILRNICMALEEYGFTSVPVHNPFWAHTGRQIRPDQPDGPDGLISLRVLGVACGLGELGLSKIFLSPQFGPRQRIFGVLTDAELEPTPLFTGSVCDECGNCVRECQAGAIPKERTVRVCIEDQVYTHGALDCSACEIIHKGLTPESSPFWNGTEKDGELPEYHTFLQRRFNHLAICVGRGCLRSCLDHLEKTGKIEKTFQLPLIEGPRWQLP